jgi:threonine dehydrogenase-like Zn-dependent dehydrogenase
VADEQTTACIQELTEGRGVDMAFEVVGRPEVMVQALVLHAAS